jgi:glycine/D-amino acid oxidase-like deaminating enzyme
VLGASTALHLARTGADVVLVDAAHDGRATAAGAGIVCPWVSGAEDGTFYRLYAAGARYYYELVAQVGTCGEHDLGYARVGGLCVSDDAACYCKERSDEAISPGRIRNQSYRRLLRRFAPGNDKQRA